MSKKSKAKKINDKQASFASGGMPNPNSMTPEQWEEWQKQHPPKPGMVGASAPKSDH